jgi:exonuclease VII small subunit
MIWLIIVIIIGSGLSSGIGYLADNYFGDTVDGLLGDYGEFDFLLTINQELEDTATKEVRKIVSEEFPGSRLKKGISIAGKVNYFLRISDELRNTKVFSGVEKKFEQIVGLENASLITEPKIYLRGMVGSSNQILREKIANLAEVDFVLTAGSGLNVIIKSPTDLKVAKQKIEDILNRYQVLQIRFPIVYQSDEMADLNADLYKKLADQFSSEQIKNLYAGQKANLDDLIKTMSQMKKFLLEYATIVQVKLPTDIEINSAQRLALSTKSTEQLTAGDKIGSDSILLTPLEEEDGVLKTLISRGDSSQITNKEVYLLSNSDRVISSLGKAEIHQPRYLLKKAASETEEAVPRLNTILADIDGLNQKLLGWLTEYQGNLSQVQTLQQKLTDQQGKLNNLGLENQEDFQRLLDITNKIVGITTNLESKLTKLSILQEELTDMSSDFKSFERGLERQLGILSLTGVESERLSDLNTSIRQLRKEITGETDLIVNKINQYNPLLNKLQNWNNNLEDFQQILKTGASGKLDSKRIEEVFNLAAKSLESMVSDLENIERLKLEDRLTNLKTKLVELDQLDLSLISKQLNQFQTALPDLKDEEITGTINLLDEYLAGQVVPGEVAYFMVSQDIDQEALKRSVDNYFTRQETKQIFTESGVIEPNIRGQLFRILGEVRETLTALIALIFTALLLFLDSSLVMVSMQYLNARRDNKLIRFLNSSYLYGALLGALLLSSIFYISQARLPYLSWVHILLIGTVLGILAANKAKSINPINRSEFLAGESLGLNYTEIMQEIVIPAGRPCFLKLLNAREMVFK